MPHEIRVDRATMVDGVVAVIEKRGYGGVSARSVADELGISTQPIYREFTDMDGLKKAAAARGWEIFSEYVRGDAVEHAVKYVMFAVERKNLFEFLYRDRNCEYNGLDDMAHKLVDDDIIDALCGITGLEREAVYRLHLYLWMALHGLASLAADNRVTLSEKELADFTVELSRAVTMYFKSKKEG